MHTPLTKALTPHCMVNHHIFNVPNLDRIAQLSKYKLTYNLDVLYEVKDLGQNLK